MLLISKSGNVDEKEMYGYKEFKIFYPLIENGVSQLFIKLTNSLDYGFKCFIDINSFNLKNSVTQLLFLIFYE